MKNQKGISLITLIFTVILMLIITSITMYSGFEAYDSMKVQTYVAKLKTLQEKVDIYCDKYSVKEINSRATQFSDAPLKAQETLREVIAMNNVTPLKSWSEVDGAEGNYRYFSAEAVEEQIGVKDFDLAIWLNPLTRNVIAVEGIEFDKVMYHRQYDLPGGQELEQPVFNTDTELKATVKTYDDKAEIKLDKSYAQITTYLKADDTSSKENTRVYTHTDTITVTESGKYRIVATDYDRNVNDYSDYTDTSIREQFAGLEKTAELNVAIVNKPLLVDGMTPIDEQGAKITTEEEKQEWYNYGDNKWANVELIDGSKYVWIPRFAYKITNGKIDIKFLREFSNITTEGKALDNDYKIAPAFQDGTTLTPTGFANGEWDSEITGFWVAKYEVIGLNSVEGGQYACSNGSTDIASMTLAPISAFKTCRSLEKQTELFGSKVTSNVSGEMGINGEFPTDTNNVDTHLMKNSEYGAVVYLTSSEYGSLNKTVKAVDGIYPGKDLGSLITVQSSTTQNHTGIYGLAGGRAEIVSAGVNIDGVFNGSNNSSKYATAYTSSEIYGDAVLSSERTVLGLVSGTAEPNESFPIYIRGGNGAGGNIAEYGAIARDNAGYGFRPVIIVEY